PVSDAASENVTAHVPVIAAAYGCTPPSNHRARGTFGRDLGIPCVTKSGTAATADRPAASEKTRAHVPVIAAAPVRAAASEKTFADVPVIAAAPRRSPASEKTLAQVPVIAAAPLSDAASENVTVAVPAMA